MTLNVTSSFTGKPDNVDTRFCVIVDFHFLFIGNLISLKRILFEIF